LIPDIISNDLQQIYKLTHTDVTGSMSIDHNKLWIRHILVNTIFSINLL